MNEQQQQQQQQEILRKQKGRIFCFDSQLIVVDIKSVSSIHKIHLQQKEHLIIVSLFITTKYRDILKYNLANNATSVYFHKVIKSCKRYEASKQHQ